MHQGEITTGHFRIYIQALGLSLWNQDDGGFSPHPFGCVGAGMMAVYFGKAKVVSPRSGRESKGRC